VETQSAPPASRYLGRGADPFLFFAGCNLSVRRSELRRAGGFNPAIPYCYEDAELCMRIVDTDARLAWVEGALVRHERAPSHIRDGEQVIQDPYSLMVSVAAFVELSAPTRAPSVLDAWLEGWRTAQAEQVPEAQRAWFRERVEQGIGDGRAAGLRPREHVELGPQPRGDFKPFV
jgi:cellulose synthase/poly-beta-1,6-N-acetylglucosamine synthase-like glycosyltransferase